MILMQLCQNKHFAVLSDYFFQFYCIYIKYVIEIMVIICKSLSLKNLKYARYKVIIPIIKL